MKDYVVIAIQDFDTTVVEELLNVQASHGFRLHSIIADGNPDPDEWGGFAAIFERDLQKEKA